MPNRRAGRILWLCAPVRWLYVGAESDDTSCSAPLCSNVRFSENASDWTVHNLSLYSSTSAIISDQVISYTADWFHIELAGPVQAEELATDDFQIEPGDAVFLLSGEVEGDPHHLVVTNASTIRIVKVGGVWKTSSFALGYSDSEDDSWVLSVAGAAWVAP